MKTLLNRLNAELKNANYDSIEAYLPKQKINAGVLKIQFRKSTEMVDSSATEAKIRTSAFEVLLIGLGLACCF